MFRINGYDSVTDNVEFYFKADRGDDNSLICNFCIAGEGIFYYRKGSKILTRNETPRARETIDAFISMQDLGNLLEMLRKARLAEYEEGRETQLKITKQGRRVIIEREDNCTQE
jgi:predicted transcriptional regulator